MWHKNTSASYAAIMLIHNLIFPQGWMFSIKLSNPEELDELMSAESYKSFCEEQES